MEIIKKELVYGSTITFTKGKQYKVKIKGKVRKDTISLFLEYYNGYEMKNGNPVPKRSKEYLGKNMPISPKTSSERKEYDEVMLFAEKVRKNREQEIEYRREGMLNPNMQKINYLSYMDAYLDSYTKKDISTIKYSIVAFKKFIGKDVLYPKEINKRLIEDFRDYTLEHYKGDTPSCILARFKKISNRAVDDGVFLSNPAKGVTCKSPTGIRKALLTMEEIQMLINTPVKSESVYNAFLFCVNTGLRFIDVKSLTYRSIVGSKLIMTQSKTMKQVIVDLNENALHFIGERKGADDLVFKLPDLSSALETLKRWTKRAGIDKNVTWHSARHTFATTLLQNKANIRTVSSLLGHSNLRHTEKYLHLVDELKTEAVNTFPVFDIKKD